MADNDTMSPTMAKAIRMVLLIATVGSWGIGFVMGILVTMVLT